MHRTPLVKHTKNRYGQPPARVHNLLGDGAELSTAPRSTPCAPSNPPANPLTIP